MLCEIIKENEPNIYEYVARSKLSLLPLLQICGVYYFFVLLHDFAIILCFWVSLFIRDFLYKSCLLRFIVQYSKCCNFATFIKISTRIISRLRNSAISGVCFYFISKGFVYAGPLTNTYIMGSIGCKYVCTLSVVNLVVTNIFSYLYLF